MAERNLGKAQFKFKTRFMADVLNVIYLGHEELSPDKQLGTIALFTNPEQDHHIIYNVQAVDMNRPFIKPGDELTLTGPSSIPSLSSYVSVDVDLFSGAYKGTLTVEVPEVPPCDSVASRTIERRLLSKDGTGELCVLFGLFYHARAAFLQMKWVSNNPPVDAYGVIASRTCHFRSPRNSRLLFLKKRENKVRLGTGDLIPLSRSMSPVTPYTTPLSRWSPLTLSRWYVDVGLYTDHGTIKGTMEFLPSTQHRTLYGENGDGIAVTVKYEDSDGDVEEEDEESPFHNSSVAVPFPSIAPIPSIDEEIELEMFDAFAL